MSETDIDQLLDRIEQADADADHFLVLHRAAKKEAAVVRATVDRIVQKTGVRIRDPLASVRQDPLRAKAGVIVETLPGGFSAHDFAVSLGIKDQLRAQRLLMLLKEIGKVRKVGDGWYTDEDEAALIRDWIVKVEMFSLDHAYAALDVDEIDPHIQAFVMSGMIEPIGDGWFEYVPAKGPTEAREDKRPPEKDPPAYTDAPQRGTPVRIVDHGKRADATGRHRGKMRDLAYNRQQDAKANRAEKQKAKAKRQ